MKRKLGMRLLAVLLAALLVSALAVTVYGQDSEGAAEESAAEETVAEEVVMATMADVEAVQTNLDLTWVLIAGFLVFFMQAGFAMLEGGFIQSTGVINSMVENFTDAALTGIFFFLVGYGIAFGASNGGLFGTSLFALDGATGANPEDGALFVSFFFQFAFAGAAGTIATGAMAERTSYWGKIIYTIIVAVIIYPVIVHWIWNADGLLASRGFHDFAGSTVVHQTGGIIALIGAIIVGARKGRVWGSPPAPQNLMMATLGTFILWFGWYGFNVGSTLGASNPIALGLVAVNTTLAACAGACSAMVVMYARTGKWDLGFTLNGSLAGLVAITASCAFVAPTSSIIIGLLAGVLVVFIAQLIESLKIDDAVGAFAVHGACGAFGTLTVGLFGLGHLTFNGEVGLLVGGGAEFFLSQLVGVLLVSVYVAITSTIMFVAVKALGLLRIPAEADEVGIDKHEHGATLYPDLPMGAAAAGD